MREEFHWGAYYLQSLQPHLQCRTEIGDIIGIVVIILANLIVKTW